MAPRASAVRLALLLAALLACAAGAPGVVRAQETRTEAPRVQASDLPVTRALTPIAPGAPQIPSNTIQVMDAQGDSLWFGPLLYVTGDGGATFLSAGLRQAARQRDQLFALDLDRDPNRTPGASASVLWAGLAFATPSGAPGAGGFLVSFDGGRTLARRPPPLDPPNDTLVTYGVSTLRAVPVTDEANAEPQGIDYDPATGVTWSANGFAGLRRSTDDGASWDRVVLPPDTLGFIAPDQPYDFLVAGPDEVGGSLNLFAFDVLVASDGTVWTGTAGGVNWSLPLDVFPSGARAWRRFVYVGTPAGLTGNSVVRLAEQPLAGQRNPIWMATWPLNLGPDDVQRFGMTVTRDNGRSFEQALVGEQVFDFAFRADTVYAAASRGLFVSANQGATWRSVRDFFTARADGTPDARVLPPDVRVLSTAVTPRALWIGTNQGLLRLDRALEPYLTSPLACPSGAPFPAPGTTTTCPEDAGGQFRGWRLFRVNVPTDPATPSDETPAVDAYAYPNPFAPANDRVVRIRYRLDEAAAVTVRIYDFAMNRVRTLRDDKPAGEQETAWNGQDEGGLRVANGVYFYTVEGGGVSARGKILVLE